jgi:hypothetical protein
MTVRHIIAASSSNNSGGFAAAPMSIFRHTRCGFGSLAIDAPVDFEVDSFALSELVLQVSI